MRRGRARRQHGQIIITFALAMALFLMGLIALVVDTATIFVWGNRAQASAQLAAVTGANDINSTYLYTGTGPIVDPTTYQPQCEQAGRQDMGLSVGDPTGSVTCTINTAPLITAAGVTTAGTCVTATVIKRVPMPVGWFGVTVPVQASFTAAPVVGFSTAIPNQPAAAGCR